MSDLKSPDTGQGVYPLAGETTFEGMTRVIRGE